MFISKAMLTKVLGMNPGLGMKVASNNATSKSPLLEVHQWFIISFLHFLFSFY